MRRRNVEILGLERLHRKLQMRIAKSMRDGTGEVVIGYSAEYAVYVHENLTNYHKPPTQAKFLELPAQMLKPLLKPLIAKGLASGKTLMQTLLGIGWRLLADSRRITPIDTGYLRESGFVRLKK